MLAPRWVAAILALGGLEAVTSYALMAPTAPHVGAFRGVHSSRISPDIAMLAKKKGKGKKGKKSSVARPPPSPTPPAAAEAAFEAVQQFRLTKGKCLLDVFLAAQPPQEKLPLRGADPAIVVQIQR